MTEGRVADPARGHGERRAGAAWLVASGAVGIVLGLLVFSQGLGAPLVSDAFVFAERAEQATVASLLAGFVPAPDRYYRPTARFAFWLLYRLFGHDALGYHVVALLCHLAASLMIGLIARRITGDTLASALAAFAFLVSLHAHEIVFEAATAHYAIAGVLLLASLLAYMNEWRVVSLCLVALALTTNEIGLLAPPLIALYAVFFRHGAARDRTAVPVMLDLAVLGAVTAAYLALRVAYNQGRFAVEVEPCRSLRCLAIGGLEYTNRLLVRPERALELIWNHRPSMALVSILAVLATAAVLRPWTWRNRRAICFAMLWTVGSALYFIVALWPYVSDRFLYIPEMGMALVIGSVAAEAASGWRHATRPVRLAAACAAVAAAAWLGCGAYMVFHRGALWSLAGRQARQIVEGTHALVPVPPPNAVFIFLDVPDSLSPGFPPGNTGPYVFRNGLGAALRLRYRRPDVFATKDRLPTGAGRSDGAIRLRIAQGNVVLLSRAR